MGERWGFAMDDPWITFRYGRNLARGLGLVFNSGERLEGYSNFLLVLLSAGFERLRLNPFDFVRLGGVFCFLGAIALVARGEARIVMGERRLAEAPSYLQFLFPGGKSSMGWWAWAGTFYLALAPQAATWAVGGLETPYYLLAAVATWCCAARAWAGDDRNAPGGSGWAWGIATGTCALLSALMRVDGVVVAAGLAAFLVWEMGWGRRPRRWGPVLLALVVFVGGYLLYTAWRVSYFGALVPNTAAAKATGPLAERIQAGLKYLFDWARGGGGLGLLIALIGSLLAVREWRRAETNTKANEGEPERPGPETGGRVDSRFVGTEGEALLWLALWLVAAQTVLIVLEGGDWMPASRFVVPMLGFVGILVGAGLRRWRRRGMWGWWVAAGAALWIVVSLWHGDRSDADLQWCLRAKEEHKLLHPLRDAGQWIGDVAPPKAWLAGTEAGIIPYYADLPFIDMLGLVDRHIASMPGGLHKKFDTDYVLDRAPRFILLGVTVEKGDDGWPLRGAWPPDDEILNHPTFRETYTPRRTFPRYEPGTPVEMVLYERIK